MTTNTLTNQSLVPDASGSITCSSGCNTATISYYTYGVGGSGGAGGSPQAIGGVGGISGAPIYTIPYTTQYTTPYTTTPITYPYVTPYVTTTAWPNTFPGALPASLNKNCKNDYTKRCFVVESKTLPNTTKIQKDWAIGVFSFKENRIVLHPLCCAEDGSCIGFDTKEAALNYLEVIVEPSWRTLLDTWEKI